MTQRLEIRNLAVAYGRTAVVHGIDLHVQADPTLSLHDAHILSGKVKGAIRSAVPSVRDVLVHMEPFEP